MNTVPYSVKMWQGLKLGDLVSSLKLSLNFLPFSLLITLLLPATIARCLLAMAPEEDRA